MKTHYAQCERANESYNQDEWSETLCGIDLENTNYLTDNHQYVSCKNCLKKLESNKQKLAKKPC